jgi:hypothetical protein
VRALLVIAPEGKVTNVEIKETPDASLGSCVAGVLQAATFDKTAQGGSFSYPFVFSKKPPPNAKH